MHADAAPYDDCLTREGRDPTAAALAGELDPGAIRDALVAQVHALAARVAAERTERDGWQSVVEWPPSRFMTGTRCLGDWQTKTAALARQAEAEGAVLAVPPPWLLPELGPAARGGTASSRSCVR